MSICKIDIPNSLLNQEGIKNIFNLSKTFILSDAQSTLLNRGLTFIPTSGSNKNIYFQTRADLQQYHRKIKLAVFYKDKDNEVIPPFTPKSDWCPAPAQLPQEVSNLIQNDLKYMENEFKIYGNKPNLKEDEVKALKELASNKDIVIKPADKGSAVVIWDREQYLWEGYRQLNNRNYYEKLPKPIFLDTIPEVEKIIKNLHIKKFINAKQKNYLIGSSEPRPRLFYMLPKIHKDPKTWSKPHEIPSGRPIVSDCNSETYQTAEFIDYYLNPLSTKHKSYIKDTYDFIEKVKNINLPEKAFLFTIDVESLYTNIDTKEGIEAVKNIFRSNPNVKRPEKELLQLLEINLTKNDFEFNGEYFLQVKGTSMGKKFAPAYADIFMAAWEEGALNKCVKKPLHYYRYLDDIWGVWTHSEEDFEYFLHSLNTHNASIKLKATTSHTSVNFLDTTTFKGPDFKGTLKLDVKVYFKETDTHTLLYKTSHHPKHTYTGLIKSQLLRFHRICTQKADFETATKVLFSALSSRGYSRSFLRRCLKSFLETRPITVDPLLPFITTYSQSATKLVKNVKQNFKQFQDESKLLTDFKIITAYRRNKNLKDYLVHAKLKPLTNPKVKGHQEFFQHKMWVQNRFNKTVYKTQYGANPRSKNCVYLVFCERCDSQYVGETKNTILTRFTQHRYNIKRNKETQTLLVKHFISHGWDALKATVLECNPRWSTAQRKRAEKIWISRLDTLEPRGLNEKK